MIYEHFITLIIFAYVRESNNIYNNMYMILWLFLEISLLLQVEVYTRGFYKGFAVHVYSQRIPKLIYSTLIPEHRTSTSNRILCAFDELHKIIISKVYMQIHTLFAPSTPSWRFAELDNTGIIYLVVTKAINIQQTDDVISSCSASHGALSMHPEWIFWLKQLCSWFSA